MKVTLNDVMKAAILGNEDIVKKWLTKQQTTDKAATLKLKLINILLVAAANGQANICKLMADTGRLDETRFWSDALSYACGSGHLATAKELVEMSHITIDMANFSNALAEASTKGHQEVTEWLIEQLSLPEMERNRWLMITACAHSDVYTVERLAREIGTDDKDVMSQALRIACWNGQVAVVEWLLAYPAANVTSCGVIRKNYGKITPLFAACYAAHTCVIKKLLPFVQPDSVNAVCIPSQNTPLHYAIWCEPKTGFSPLHLACAKGDIDDVVLILFTDGTGEAVNKQSNEGYTPLHIAAQNGYLEIVQVLLAYSAKRYLTDDSNQTPAEIARKYGHHEIKNLILGLQPPSNDPDDPMILQLRK